MKKRLIVLINLMIMVFLAGNVQAIGFDDLGGVDIHGFIAQGWMISDENNFFADTEEDGTLQFNEMGLNFSTDISDKLRIGAQFFSRDLGTLSNNEVEVDWAFADYHYQDWMGLLVGKIKIPLGFYNEFRDVDSLRTPVFLPQSIYNEAWRPIFSSCQGAGLYGDISLQSLGSVNYTAMFSTANMGADNGTARTFEDQVTVYATDYFYVPLSIDVTEFDMSYFYVGRVQWSTPVPGLRLGVSMWDADFTADYVYTHDNGDPLTINDPLVDVIPYYGPSWELSPAAANSVIEALSPSSSRIPLNGDTNQAEASATSYILSGELMLGDLVLSGEYARVTYDFLFNTESSEPKAIPKFDSEGYYGSASYQITRWFQVGAYYSEYYSKAGDKDGEERVAKKDFDEGQEHRAWLKDTCLTTRFDITDNWICKLEGHVMDGAAIMVNKDNPPEGDETRSTYEQDWFLFAAKVSYRF